MSKTKITVVSSDKQHLQDIARLLNAETDLGEVAAIHGGTRELESLADAPDVLIINGMLPEEGGLDSLERLGQMHPHTSFIVVSDNQSPEFLRQAMRAGVREVLPGPVVKEQLLSAIGRLRQKRSAQPTVQGKVLSFISCKGGSGSTFLATNLAYVLAALEGKKVALIDLNLQFGDAALFASETKPATNLAEVAQQIHRLDASFLAAAMVSVLPNFSVLAAPEDPAHAADVKPQHVETIVKLARQHYDYVVLDVGRSLDAVTLQALDMADMIFPVLQLTLPFIRDGKRLIGVLRSLDYPKSKINLIVNRFEKGNEISLADLESALATSVYKTIPNSYQAVANSVNQGVPIAKLARNNPVSKSLHELAQTIAPPTTQAGSWFSKVLGRS